MKPGKGKFGVKGGGFGRDGGFAKNKGDDFGVESDLPDVLENVDYTGNVEKDSAAELTALQEGMKARAKAERERYAKATDTEFWFALYFEDRAEKEAFLKAAGVKIKMMGDKYIDGRDFARVLGIKYDY